MIARAGSGHIGSSFSSLDIVSWLFLNELNQSTSSNPSSRDIYFSSKGHDAPGLYSVLIGLGFLKFDLLHSLRRLGGLPGHPDVSVPFMETNTGPLGMGISKAEGLALAYRLQGKEGRIYVLTGDGELQEGQIWESLLSAGNRGLGEITVIVDHNKIQSDTWVSKVSSLGDLEGKFTSFGWYVSRCNGHDLESIAATISTLKKIKDKPKVIIADTIKGRGVSLMEPTGMGPEEKWYRFHSGAPSEEAYSRGVAELIDSANHQLQSFGVRELKTEAAPQPERPPINQQQRLVSAYSKALVNRAKSNSRIVVLDADLVLDCGLIPFQESFPDRFFECGIAEQDMVSQAGGMALKGFLPIVHSFSCFLSSRPNEQIYNNATERTKIIYVGSLAGLLPGMPGHSHQCVRDISSLSAIPGLLLIEPCNETEVSQILDFCIDEASESSYLRLVSIPCEIPYTLPGSYRLVLGKGVSLTEGQDAILFSYGPVMLSQAFIASKILKERYGIGLKVVNLPWLNRFNQEWLKEMVEGYKWIFTLDNHYVVGGQGEMISSSLAERGFSHQVRIKRFGVLDIPACGQNSEVLKAHRLDADHLAEEIAKLLSFQK
jgi:transketolase